MRSRYSLALVMSVVALAGATATSGAKFECFQSSASASACEGRLTLTVTGDVRPRALPEREKVPISLGIRGTIANESGAHPPALREVVLDLDRRIGLDASSFPVCKSIHGPVLDIRRDLRDACPNSIVGRGTAEIAFASGRPPERVPLTFFNAGVVEGAIGLVVQIDTFVPLQAGMRVERAPSGRYGQTATWRLPPIASGDGSLTKFSFRLKRGYVRARCTDGKLWTSIAKALFRNESTNALTILSGIMVTPCTPKS